MISEIPQHPRVILRINDKSSAQQHHPGFQQHDMMRQQAVDSQQQQASPAPKGFSYFRQPRQWPTNNGALSGHQTSIIAVNQSTPAINTSIPPPPPPPPPVSNVTAAKALFSGQAFSKNQGNSNNNCGSGVHQEHNENGGRSRSPDHAIIVPPAFLASQDTGGNHTANHLRPHAHLLPPPHLHSSSNLRPAPQIRKSLSNKINQGKEFTSHHQSQISSNDQQHFFGEHHTNILEDNDEPTREIVNIFPKLRSFKQDGNGVEVRNEATQTRGPPPSAARGMTVIKPGNQLLSLLYLLLHLGLTICLLRISGK